MKKGTSKLQSKIIVAAWAGGFTPIQIATQMGKHIVAVEKIIRKYKKSIK